MNSVSASQVDNSETVDWTDNHWNNSKDTPSRESSRVTFDLDTEAKSTPISCRPMTVNSASKLAHFSPGSGDIDYDLGDEKMSQSLEIKIKSCQSRNISQLRNASYASSIYSVGVTSNTELFVDYSCGMFAQGSLPSNSEHKDIQSQHNDGTGSSPCKSSHVTITQCSDNDVSKVVTLENPSVTKLKSMDDCDGAGNNSKIKLHLEGVVTKEDKPSLFKPITGE